MIFGEFIGIGLAHALKWVELALQIALEGVASFHDLVHDLKSLRLRDSWTKWVVSEVSSDSDSRGVDHG